MRASLAEAVERIEKRVPTVLETWNTNIAFNAHSQRQINSLEVESWTSEPENNQLVKLDENSTDSMNRWVQTRHIKYPGENQKVLGRLHLQESLDMPKIFLSGKIKTCYEGGKKRAVKNQWWNMKRSFNSWDENRVQRKKNCWTDGCILFFATRQQ